MRIKQLEELKNKIRPYLRDYLEEHDTKFEGNHLTCPNKSAHRNDDNTPSASFFPDDEHIKCFVCDEVINADIFACAYFLEGKPLTGSEFISDNVLYLAKKFGIPYEIEDISEKEKQTGQLRELLEIANKMMRAVIKQNHPSLQKVQDYIKKRRWEKIIDKFEFGYCLYDKLIANLEKRGYTNEQLEMAGLMDKENEKNQNSAKGVLNNRLVFPIRDGYGRIVGFASRRLEDKNGETKYLNFRATNLYRKADILYNLKEAKNHPKVYIVEGYSDVWALSLRGIDNVIALCGLGFSDKQYDLLVYNRIKQLCLNLDNDEAGKEATIRIVEEKLKNKADIEVTIKELDEAKDPDEYLQNHSTKEFFNLPEFTIFDWKLQDLKKNKENEFLKNDLIQLIVNEEDYITTEQMIRDLSDALDVTFDALKKEVERNRKLGRGKYLLTSRDILKEKASLENEVNNFESWAWSRGNSLLGLETGYPILTKKLDGLQNAFYLLAGDTNIGKCLCGDTRITLATGKTIPIKELKNFEGTQLIGFDLKKKKYIQTKMTKFYNNGIKNVYELTTTNGKRIKATANHPFFTIDGWKSLKNLKVEEGIAVPQELSFFNSKSPITKEQIKILAYLIAEGCFSLKHRKIDFTNTNKQIVNDFCQSIKQSYPEILIKNYKDITYTLTNNRKLKDFLILQGIYGKLSRDKFVPDSLYRCSKEDTALFLRHLFDCDGSIFESNGYIRIEFGVSSEKLASDVQNLLLKFGLHTKFRAKKFRFNNKPQVAYIITLLDIESIRKFIREIGFFTKQKKAIELLKKHKSEYPNGKADIIPVDENLINHIYNIHKNSNKTWREFAKYCHNVRSAGKGFLKRFEKLKRTSLSKQMLYKFATFFEDEYLLNLLELPIFWDKIKTIRYIGKEETFDITVPKAHNFIANNIIVHNSALLLNLSLNLIKDNGNDVFVLFFSIDDNVRQVLPRLLATTTDLEINTIANPKFKIKYNKELAPEKVEELLKIRENAVNDLKGLANSFAIKEENDIRSIEEMEKYIRIYKEIAGKKQLVVIVDNLHRIKTELRFASTRETYMYISDTLKRWKTDYDVPVVATAEIKKINSLRRPTGDDIKEVKDLQFDSDLTVLLYNDFYLKDDSTLYFVDNSGESQPIIEMAIIKNKTGGFKGKLYYKFYKDISKIVECTREEMETYFQDFQK